jgi:hypothetical protein
MSNGPAIVVGSFVIAVGLTLSGGAAQEFARQYFNRQVEAACWISTVTTGLNDLVLEEAKPVFKASYPDAMSASDQDATTESFSITLSNYGFTSSSDEGGTINCNASMSFNYTRPDKTTYTNNDGNIVSYQVHPSQGGYSSEMNAADVPTGVIAYTSGNVAVGAPTTTN